jgi:hypothetical protein
MIILLLRYLISTILLLLIVRFITFNYTFKNSISSNILSLSKKDAAVIMIGEFRNELSPEILNIANTFDMFISTYDEFKNFTDIIDSRHVITFPRKNTLKFTNMYQWWHLDNVLKTFYRELKQYDIILKIRTDSIIHENITIGHFKDIKKGVFYMNSDHSFYSDSDTFLKVMSNFWNDINKIYCCNNGGKYFEMNWDNVRQASTLLLKNNDYNSNRNKRYRVTRVDTLIGIREQVYTKNIYDKNITVLVNNILNRRPNISSGFTNRFASGNKWFGSEKFFFLHVVNRAKIEHFFLPTIGIS